MRMWRETSRLLYLGGSSVVQPDFSWETGVKRTPKYSSRDVSRQSGQMLVIIVAFMAMGVVLTSAAALVAIINGQAASKYTLGQEALGLAESGVDNALMRIIRNPTGYTGETLNINGGTVTITVSGTSPKTIVAVATLGNVRRTVTATATQGTNTVLTLTSWSETP